MNGERLHSPHLQCRIAIALFVLAFLVGNVAAQPIPPASQPTQGSKTSSTATVSAQGDYEDAFETLAQSAVFAPNLDVVEWYAQHPLRLRSVTARVLAQLPGFSTATARRVIALVRRVQARGERVEYALLQDSLRLSREQRIILERCTTLDEDFAEVLRQTLRQVLNGDVRYRVRSRFALMPTKGLREGVYEGSGVELYQRLNYRSEQMEALMTATKDAGERSAADFVSGFVRAAFANDSTPTPSFHASVLAGDYTLDVGFGMMLGSFVARKGVEVIAPALQYGLGVQPYRSAVETQFFRGVAVQGSARLTERSALNAVAWGSVQPRAATVDSTGRFASALDNSGLFRAPNEIARRGALTERSAGANVEYALTPETTGEGVSASFGVAAMALEYDKIITSRALGVFSGQRGVLANVYGLVTVQERAQSLNNTESSRFSRRNGALWTFGGELVRDALGNLGGTLALSARGEALEAVVRLRSAAAAFRAPFGVNFGESQTAANEFGGYAGLVWRGVSGVGSVSVSSFVDVYGSHEPTATVAVPVRGVEAFSELRADVRETSQILVRLRHERKTDELSLTDPFNRTQRRTADRERSSLRVEWQERLSDAVQLRSRAEGVLTTFSGYAPAETGVLWFGDVVWRPEQQYAKRFSVQARIVLFSAASADAALWQFEPMIPGVLSNPMLVGRGVRGILQASIAPAPWLQCWLRGEMLHRSDVERLGSGNDELTGNTSAHITLQMEIRL
jgi:hypothetical protein